MREHCISVSEIEIRRTGIQGLVHFVWHIKSGSSYLHHHCNEQPLVLLSIPSRQQRFIILLISLEILRIHARTLYGKSTFCTVVVNTFNVFWGTDVGSTQVFKSAVLFEHLSKCPFSFCLACNATFCRLFICWVDNHFAVIPLTAISPSLMLPDSICSRTLRFQVYVP